MSKKTDKPSLLKLRKSTPTSTELVSLKETFPKTLSIAEILEAWRESWEIPKSEMAKKLDVSPSRYGNIVNGGSPVSPKMAGGFGERLGLPKEYLVSVAVREQLQRNGFSVQDISLKLA